MSREIFSEVAASIQEGTPKDEAPKNEIAAVEKETLVSGDALKVIPNPRRRFYIFINGIETKSDMSRNIAGWHFAAERYIDLHTTCPSSVYAYEVRTFQRYRMQGRIVRVFARFISDIDPALFSLVLVGHSNGCQVICQALKQHPEILKVAEVHLIGAACDSSFRKNGLNDLLSEGRVGHVFVYYDPYDNVLKWAQRTEWIPFLRYGSLGLTGPKDVTPGSNVVGWAFHHWGHSEYFAPGNFEEIMKRVVDGAKHGTQ